MLKEQLKEVERRIQAACDRAGRKREEVTLIAVSKTKPVSMIEETYQLGIHVYGENKVQELTEKYEILPKDIEWHMIGHLQRNKVKQVVGKVALIQSVGSLPLLEAVEKEAEKQDIVQDILLEVNIGGEEAKSGFAPGALNEAACYAKTLPHVRVLGLMTIPPVETEPHGNMPLFTRMKALYVDINQNIYDNKLKYLSVSYTHLTLPTIA